MFEKTNEAQFKLRFVYNGYFNKLFISLTFVTGF